MIDLHAHVLPGLDDGPETLDGAREILEAAHEDGITHLAATPHVRSDYPTTPEQMEAGLREVRALGSGVQVLSGGELDIEYVETLDDDALRRFGLGGNERLLLLEFPYVGWPLQLRDLVFRLGVRGFGVVVAHPERSSEVQQRPERLRELADAGVVIQLTAASVDGRLGRRAAATARELIDTGLAHMLASDAHAPAVRAIGMQSAVDELDDRPLATWLTDAVPRALLESRPLPARPQRRRRTMRLPWHR